MAETWHVYQEQTGAFFRSLGLGAEINKLVVGARARHKIDVAVEFERWGLRHLWIVECKQHQRPIEKADVETLKSIASDVGASVALLLAESGFQPGAISAARSTNVVPLVLDFSTGSGRRRDSGGGVGGVRSQDTRATRPPATTHIGVATRPAHACQPDTPWR